MAIRLTKPQARALRGIAVMRRSGGVEMATLRANGNRSDVIYRLCNLGLAFIAGDYGHRDRERFDLTANGTAAVDEMEES